VGAILIPVLALALPGPGLPLPVDRLAVMPPWEVASGIPVQPGQQPALSGAPAPAPPAAAEGGGDAAAPSPPPAAGTSASASPSPAPAAATRIRWPDVFVGVYLVGALLLLAKVAAEHLVVRRYARRARPAASGEWKLLLRSVAAAFGVRREVVLLRSAGHAMPLTWGVVRPFVLIPTDADEWPPSRRQAVLLHEIAHVARHDCLTQTLAAIACALYWPHPGIWWAAHRLRIERELACDDHALARGIPPHDYAGHLLAVARARHAARRRTALALAMAAPSHLEMRIRAAIDRTPARTVPGRRVAALGAVLTMAFLLPLSVIRADGAQAASDPPPDAGPSGAGEVATSPLRTAPSTEASADAGAGDGAHASSQAPLEGAWTIRMAEADGARETREAHRGTPVVHVALRAPGLNTFYVPLTSLEGLTAGQVASSGAVRFRLRKDAAA
jgi:beta-lactamase regulating signal transducer with metallopeptidase domain